MLAVENNPSCLLVPAEWKIVLVRRLSTLEAGRVSLLGSRVQASAASQPPIGEPLRERLDVRVEVAVLRILRAAFLRDAWYGLTNPRWLVLLREIEEVVW